MGDVSNYEGLRSSKLVKNKIKKVGGRWAGAGIGNCAFSIVSTLNFIYIASYLAHECLNRTGYDTCDAYKNARFYEDI